MGTSASFRDPGGSLRVLPQGAFRRVGAHAAARTLAFQTTRTWQALVAEGAWTDAQAMEPEAWEAAQGGDLPGGRPGPGELCLQHPRIWFPSYPTEWTPAQLFDAGLFILGLQRRLLGEDWELKDATPYNLLLEGTRWVHVDHLSPQRLEEGGAAWGAFGQFHRTFFMPLLLHRELRLPPSWIFNARRDGIHPEEAERLLGWRAWMGWQAFQHVKAASLLRSRRLEKWIGAMAPGRPDRNLRLRLLDHLEKDFRSLEPKAREGSAWASYGSLCPSYSPEDQALKLRTVESWLQRLRPASLLDLGCNTGTFSLVAAEAGARVVATDADSPAVASCWRAARGTGADIQPLVMNVGAPTPAMGWENRECSSFLDRARGRFEAVAGLALLHHLLVGERIPLDGLVDAFAAFTRRWAILEFIHPRDPMFLQIAGPNQDLYAHLDQARFEEALARRFRILERLPLKEGLRCLYLLQSEPA